MINLPLCLSNKKSFKKAILLIGHSSFDQWKLRHLYFFQYENSPHTSLRTSGWWKLKRKWKGILPRRDGGPKGAALLGVHLEVFFYPLCIRSKSDHSCPMAYWLQLLQAAHFPPLSFRDLCWAKHAGALTGNTQNSKFTSMTTVQHFKLFLIIR